MKRRPVDVRILALLKERRDTGTVSLTTARLLKVTTNPKVAVHVLAQLRERGHVAQVPGGWAITEAGRAALAHSVEPVGAACSEDVER